VAFTDVHYVGDRATAACIVAANWSDPAPREEHVTTVPSVKPYRPGAFFERELPCLLQVLALVTVPIQVVVVDGYVDLDELGAPGLGAHLHAGLGGRVAVVGVAKTSFRGATFAVEVLRGKSRTPLYVTARGIAMAEAARLVHGMHGPHRIPTLLRRVDQLARGHVRPSHAP
jgi:deoxyribonuclease V